MSESRLTITTRRKYLEEAQDSPSSSLASGCLYTWAWHWYRCTTRTASPLAGNQTCMFLRGHSALLGGPVVGLVIGSRDGSHDHRTSLSALQTPLLSHDVPTSSLWCLSSPEEGRWDMVIKPSFYLSEIFADRARYRLPIKKEWKFLFLSFLIFDINFLPLVHIIQNEADVCTRPQPKEALGQKRSREMTKSELEV